MTGTTLRRLFLLPAVWALAVLTLVPVEIGATSVQATAAAAPPQCPAVLPLADVRAGMRGRGWTVTQGRTPKEFAVSVLGVLEDALAPGRDMILVRVSDLRRKDVIAQGGGIWAGMSGSPVYVDGKLLGAIAFGFTASPSPIGGVTPAEDMMTLLRLGAEDQAPGANAEPDVIAIPPELQSLLGADGAQAAGPTLTRLPMPLGVSGLSSQRLSRLQSDVDRAGLSFVTHAGGAQAAPTATTTLARPTAGGNFVAALSYGDVTAAAVGTTTAVCDGVALAFGHPFQLIGAAALGANDATALAIIRDATFGSVKFATVGAPFGTIDQDRLAGVRGDLGALPETIPVSTSVTAVDLDRTRTGGTRVTDDRFLPALTLFGLIGSIDSTFDEVGDGTATSEWTISGTRAGGVPFEVSRTNRWASLDDIAVEMSFDVAFPLDQLLNNPIEEVHVDGVRFSSSVSTDVRQLRVVDAVVSVNGGPFTRPEALMVPPGATLRARVALQPFRSTETVTAELELTVPQGTAGRFGSLQVVGGVGVPEGGGEPGGPGSPGGGDESCLFGEQGCAVEPPQSLDTLLEEIRKRPRNDDLALVLQLDPAPEEATQPLTHSSTRRLDQVVTGFLAFPLQVTG